jgi:hypothetical protein
MLDLGAASIADLQGALAAGEFTSVDLVKVSGGLALNAPSA